MIRLRFGVAQSLRDPGRSVEERADTLEQPGRLRDTGVITPEEFECLKAPLLDG